jgi:uncharacterized membrane protein YphA (DoxX/SURF4 family)
MPRWIPAPAFIDYLTGAFLIIAGVCFLLARRTRMAATYLGAWIVLLVVVIYGPVLFGALADPSTEVQVEGLNYFADTLLFGGVILSLARASTAIPPPSPESVPAKFLRMASAPLPGGTL